MRIALRTGGGRGVYELAGTQGSYRAFDLFDKSMFYELTPSLIVPGRAMPSNRQGKPRIKLDNQNDTTHFYRLLAGLLLLPKPKREFKKTSGDVLVAFEAYSITAIKIDVVTIDAEKSIVRPTEILLENANGLKKCINFVDRMARILEVWRVASQSGSPISNLIRIHQSTVYSPEINHKLIEKASKNIFDFCETIYDPLQKIESLLNIEQDRGEIDRNTDSLDQSLKEDFGIDDAILSELANVENVRRWRKVAARGSSASKFSNYIKEAYQHTCCLTGQRLPKLESISSSGVDAAHILPWASHGINAVDNGICLSKQYHWAFDSGVIKLSFDRRIGEYIVSIPERVMIEAQFHGFSIEPYASISGVVPRERLPRNPAYWPNPDYLDALNKIMFG